MTFGFAHSVALLVLAMPIVSIAQDGVSHSLWHDGSKIVSPRECESCHHKEYALWQGTGHARHAMVDEHYETAEYVKSRMGILSMNSNSLCVKCHYTGMKAGNRMIAVAGVSCESCHGPAKDWLNLHNAIPPNEDAAQRNARREMVVTRGMVRPTELYELASRCFQCHTVPEEELVNRGGHNTGTRDFELLSAIEEVRHNFLHARFAAGNAENTPPDMYRKRIIFTLGRIMEVEFSLRALSTSTAEGRYRKAMMKRLTDACVNLSQLCRIEYFPEIVTILRETELVKNQRDFARAGVIANRLSVLGKRFADSADPRSLEGIDRLLLSQNSQK